MEKTTEKQIELGLYGVLKGSGFPKIRGTYHLGGPCKRSIAFGGL